MRHDSERDRRRLNLHFVLGLFASWLVFTGTLAWGEGPSNKLQLIPAQWNRQPVLMIPCVRGQPPTIDGVIAKGEWAGAASTSAFFDIQTGVLVRNPVRLYVTYDQKAMYVAMDIHRPIGSAPPRAQYGPGHHQSMWWQDDSFELTIEPPHAATAAHKGYVFLGNSAGGWSDLRYDSPGFVDTAWHGQWEYKASPTGHGSWHAELKIPFSQFEGVGTPKPGDEWALGIQNQPVTPQKQPSDWSGTWGFGGDSYQTSVRARIILGGANDPIFRFEEFGKLESNETAPTCGVRLAVTNPEQAPRALKWHADLFRCAPRPAGTLAFIPLWDRVREVQRTGKPLKDPNEPTQAQRSEADLLKELNGRYAYVTSESQEKSLQPGETAHFVLAAPAEVGEYVLGCECSDAKTGEVLAAQVLPYQVLPKFELSLKPFFLSHQKIRATVQADNPPTSADRVHLSLIVEGKQLDQADVPLARDAEETHGYLSTVQWAAEQTGQVQAQLLDRDGKVLETANASLLRPPTPAWFDQKLGESQVVPPPYGPVTSTAENTATVWQREIRFGPNALPESIKARGDELLARPMALRLKAGNLTEHSLQGTMSRTGSTPREVVFESSEKGGALTLHTRTAMHYDGTMRYDIELIPERATKVQDLVLEIPLQARWAQLFAHQGTGTDFSRVKVDGEFGKLQHWFDVYKSGAMPFTFAFFLGSYDRGIQWFCGSDQGWSNANEDKKISLVRQGDEVVLRIVFIDREMTLDKLLKLNFGLTVTPLKPVERGKEKTWVAFNRPQDLREKGLASFDRDFPAIKARGVDMVFTNPTQATAHGQPYLYDRDDIQFMKQFVALTHNHGMLYLPYGGWGVCPDAPGFELFAKEMLKEPLRSVGYGDYWHNPASTFQDWWLGGAKWQRETMDFDGVYLDGTAMPELTANELDGFAWKDDKGHAHGTYPVWACRRFMERLFVLEHCELGRPGLVQLHDGRMPLYFVTAFTDSTVAGEYHMALGRHSLLDVFTPDEFAVYYATVPQGDERHVIWYNWMKLPVSENQMEAMTFLHDEPQIASNSVFSDQIGYKAATQPWPRLRLLRKAFTGADFLPYWGGTSVARLSPTKGGVLSSGWVDRVNKRAMVIISNLGTEPWAGDVQLNGDNLGVDAHAKVVDGMFNLPLKQTAGQSIPVRLAGQSYRLFLELLKIAC